MGWNTVFHPRTRGWGRTGQAIDDYVKERQAEQRQGAGSDQRGAH